MKRPLMGRQRLAAAIMTASLLWLGSGFVPASAQEAVAPSSAAGPAEATAEQAAAPVSTPAAAPAEAVPAPAPVSTPEPAAAAEHAAPPAQPTPLVAEPGISPGISEYSDINPLDKVKAALSQSKVSKSTADHSKFKELQGPFASGPEVTKACLNCHNKAGQQFMKNKHWTWDYKHPVTGKQLGKDFLINNFCTNARGNEGMCAQCHAGYNRTDVNFDLTNQENIDCLVCHDQTGTYYKTPTTKGNAACSVMFKSKPPLEWAKMAQNVGQPSRANCGKCHFYGGGGDNVKHGDLSSALFAPEKAVDVHMDAKGLNFACITCHVGEGHEWDGSRYTMHAKEVKGRRTPGLPRDEATCEACHSNQPHPKTSVKGIKLNGHTDKVACETCHIPDFAKGGVATMTDWNWRTAGKLKNGEGYAADEFEGYSYKQGDGHERHVYKSIKGNFKYAENLQPVYRWFNGEIDYTTIDTKFDADRQPVEINKLMGDKDDPKARIWPFKEMRTFQPYDKGNNTLVYMHLWGDDSDAYWGNYDMSKAIARGMRDNDKPFSGEFGYLETISYWPINHMVAPKSEALKCDECHSREGRLKDLAGFYMPGRDSFGWLDILGYLALAGALGGVLLHGLLRFLLRHRNQH